MGPNNILVWLKDVINWLQGVIIYIICLYSGLFDTEISGDIFITVDCIEEKNVMSTQCASTLLYKIQVNTSCKC